MRFGETLRQLRKETNQTQAALAEQIGVSHAYISALERGDKPAPRFEIVVSLARSLGTDEDELWQIARSEREERLVERIQGLPTSMRKLNQSHVRARPTFASISLEIKRLAYNLEQAVLSKEEHQLLLEELKKLDRILSPTGDHQ